MTKVIYKNTISYVINMTITEDDEPKDLTNATVLLKLYERGTNTLNFSGTCVIDDASNGLCHYTTVSGDFDTVGSYYSLIELTYTGGEIKTVDGEDYEIVEHSRNLVTYAEFLEFVDIPTENAKPEDITNSYLEEAEDLLNFEVPSLANSSSSDYIEIKKAIVKRSAAITYFMNMSEGNINPDLRIAKINLWKEDKKLLTDQLNNVLSSDVEEGQGVCRRVRSTDYENESSYLYSG